MSIHDPAGQSICIHGVCVRVEHRRKGIATALLKEYLNRISAAADDPMRLERVYERVLLITHEEMRKLYEGAGFTWIGKSDVAHGSKPWFEMRWDVPSTSAQQIPPNVFDALQQTTSKKKRPLGKLLSDFSGMSDVSVTNEKSGKTLNAFDLLCPRSGCGCVILNKGLALLEEHETVQVCLSVLRLFGAYMLLRWNHQTLRILTCRHFQRHLQRQTGGSLAPIQWHSRTSDSRVLSLLQVHFTYIIQVIAP
jgi:guanine nucleotide exchange factor